VFRTFKKLLFVSSLLFHLFLFCLVEISILFPFFNKKNNNKNHVKTGFKLVCAESSWFILCVKHLEHFSVEIAFVFWNVFSAFRFLFGRLLNARESNHNLLNRFELVWCVCDNLPFRFDICEKVMLDRTCFVGRFRRCLKLNYVIVRLVRDLYDEKVWESCLSFWCPNR